MLVLLQGNQSTSLASCFIAGVFLFAALVVYAAAKVSRQESGIPVAARIAIGFAVWLAVTGTLAVRGFFVSSDSLPPRVVFGVVPAFATVAALMANSRSRRWLLAIPPVWLIVFQTFRVAVELGLLAMHQHGIVPRVMTIEGQNFDMLTGLTALPIAYLCFGSKRWPQWVAIAWNIAGLALVLNVLRLGFLTAPGPLYHATGDVPNLVPSLFPFIWLPYFLVPLAILGNLVSLTQLLSPRGEDKA